MAWQRNYRSRNAYGWEPRPSRYITGPSPYMEAEVLGARTIFDPIRSTARDALRSVPNAASRTAGALSKFSGRSSSWLSGLGRAAKAAPIIGVAAAGIGVVGVGGALALGMAGIPLAAHEAKYASGQWKRAEEAAVMSRLIANSQVGPFGTGDRPYGMSSNYGNSAGMTLALHYARNGTRVRDPFMQMMGGLAGGQAGKFIGGF